MKRRHPIYSRDATVFLETPLGEEGKLDVMRRAIETSGFLGNVESALERSGKDRSDFQIAVKPNIMTATVHQENSSVYTDPELVEELLRQLQRAGFTKLTVVESRNVYDYAVIGRSVKAVAEMVGYSAGKGYEIADLSEETEPWDYGGVLGLHVVGKAWRDADYRISFAKNKTHYQCFYTGCLKNIYGCLPEPDKMKHYHGKGREFYECCILMLDAFDVHFGFLDAWTSGDGLMGHLKDSSPNETRTIFASENIFALDWVMGEKMSLDPSQNYVIQEAMHRWGTMNITRHGNMTPWQGWRNVRAIVVIALSALEEMYPVAAFFSRAGAAGQDKRFRRRRWQFVFGPLQGLTQLLSPIGVKRTPKRAQG